MSESSWNKGLDDAACGVPPRSEYASDQAYQEGYAFGDHRHENYQGPKEQQPPQEPGPYSSIFQTTVLGVGPYCVEFHGADGEIITMGSRKRAQAIAAVPDMIEALNKIALESKHNIRTWTELDYQDAMSTIGKIAQTALRKAGQID